MMRKSSVYLWVGAIALFLTDQCSFDYNVICFWLIEQTTVSIFLALVGLFMSIICLEKLFYPNKHFNV